MKKITSVFALTILTVTLFLVGRGKHAKPIAIPSVNEIDSIYITTLDGSEVSSSNKELIEQFIIVVTQAESTTKESIQDVPNSETYGKVDISNNGGITTFFYYTEDKKFYIEQPYQGIYETYVNIDVMAKRIDASLSQ